MKTHKILSLALVLVLCAGRLAVPAEAYNMGEAGTYNRLSAGSSHTAFVDENGSLWTWGHNNEGGLGNGDRWGNSAVPVKVLDNVVSVSCGTYHTAAIDANGSLWTWGNNWYGQLGNGTKESIFIPAKVMDNVTAVSCGGYHTAVIRTDGTLWVFGSSRWDPSNTSNPKQTVFSFKIMDDVAAVSCGGEHTAAIRTDGSLWMWGSNDYGQVGNGGGETVDGVYGGPVQRVPVKVLDDVTAVSCGSRYTAAIKTDGSLWMWGYNGFHQLGNEGGGNAEAAYGGAIQTVPIKVLDDVAAVNCGGSHTAAIRTDGSLWTWGNNFSGELGNNGGGDAESAYGMPVQTTPVKVLDDVAAVSCGGSHTAAIRKDGSLWTWGSNRSGELGNNGGGNRKSAYGVADSQTVPAQITLNAEYTAYPSAQTVTVDGKAVEFSMYALKDENGNMTHYVKVRDVASVLSGTAAQFDVGYFGMVNIVKGWAYTSDGSEMKVPFSGDRAYIRPLAPTNVDNERLYLDAIVLTDDNGGGYTYYQLRVLGKVLGFNVGWSNEKGLFIETDKPYSDQD